MIPSVCLSHVYFGGLVKSGVLIFSSLWFCQLTECHHMSQVQVTLCISLLVVSCILPVIVVPDFMIIKATC